jgi:glutamine amidotransferase
MNRIGIVDYNAGNLGSIVNSVASFGFEYSIFSSPPDRRDFSTILIPGVGSFKHVSTQLRDNGLRDFLRNEAKIGTPLVGICLGMQLLATSGHEYGIHAGLDLIPGEVIALNSVDKERVPHLGWSRIFDHNSLNLGYVYFAHSYYFDIANKEAVNAYFEWGENHVPAIIQDGNVIGFQFHPEKSGETGLSLLKKSLDI